jgi:hypothetical protein
MPTGSDTSDLGTFFAGSFVVVIRSVLAGCRSRVIKVWDDRVGKLPIVIPVSAQTLVFADKEVETG